MNDAFFMPNRSNSSLRRCDLQHHLVLMLFLILGANPACLSAQDQNQRTTVAPFDISDADTAPGMTMLELEDSLRRYADRFRTRIAVATYSIRENPLTSEQNLWMQTWNSMSFSTAVNIAVGPDAVTNLLDFMVLASLSRMVVEDYWLPEFLGEETGAPLLSATRALEEDIWSVADDVLTQDQKEELLSLVGDWHKANPDQILPWLIRMDEFSGQRADRLSRIKETGGLLKEVRKAREAAENLQIFGERFLYFMQRSGGMMANAMETNTLQLLNGPDVQRFLTQSERFVQTTEELTNTIERMPGEQWTVMNQLLEGIAAERLALTSSFSEAAPEMRAMLEELRKTVEATERLMEHGSGNDEPFDVNAYQALIAEAANTATELRLLIQTMNTTSRDAKPAIAAIDELIEKQKQIVDHVFIRVMVLTGFSIVLFFAALAIYRRLLATHPSRTSAD